MQNKKIMGLSIRLFMFKLRETDDWDMIFLALCARLRFFEQKGKQNYKQDPYDLWRTESGARRLRG